MVVVVVMAGLLVVGDAAATALRVTLTSVTGKVERLSPTLTADGQRQPPPRVIRVREELTVTSAASGSAPLTDGVTVARWLPRHATVQSVRQRHLNDSVRRAPLGKLPWRLDNHSEALEWTAQGSGASVLMFSVVYTLTDAVLPVQASPYEALAVVKLMWPLLLGASASVGPTAAAAPSNQGPPPTAVTAGCNITLEVAQWESGDGQHVLCGERPFALYSKSGYAIRSASSCHVCPVRHHRKGHRAAPLDDECSRFTTSRVAKKGLHVAFGAGPTGAGASAWVIQLVSGTHLQELALRAPPQTAYCRQLMHNQHVSWVEQFVGDVTYPLKVVFMVVPVAMLGMLLAVTLARRFAIIGAVAAVVSNLVDIALIGAAGVFPTCSVAVAGRGYGVGDMVALAMLYAVSAVAFWGIDKMVSERFALPDSIAKYHMARWGPAVSSGMPAWLPLPLAAGLLYIAGILWWATELVSGGDMLSVVVVVMNAVQWLPILRALKEAIAARRQTGGPCMPVLRASFVLWLVEPIAVLYLLVVDPATAVLLAGAAVLAGASTSLFSNRAAATGRAQSLFDSVQEESTRRLSRLRPKQRALLQMASA
jgi:hypothetical protein